MFSELQKLLPSLERFYDKRLLLVTSLGKSGSTWVQKILDNHPDILCAGEAKLRCLLAHLNNAVPEHDRLLKLTNEVVYGNDNEFRPWGAETGKVAAQFLVALAFATMDKTVPSSVTYVGNKDTDYIYEFDVWHRELFPDAKFIHVIRDVRDVVVSNIHHLNRMGREIRPGTDTYYDTVRTTAEHWNRLVSRAHDAAAVDHKTCLEVKYESLLDSPYETARGMFAYLGVDASDDITACCVDETSFERLSGGRPRGHEDRNSFYRKGVSGDWRTALDDESRAIVARCAGSLLARLGYPDD